MTSDLQSRTKRDTFGEFAFKDRKHIARKTEKQTTGQEAHISNTRTKERICESERFHSLKKVQKDSIVYGKEERSSNDAIILL